MMDNNMFSVRQPYHPPNNFKFSSRLAGKVYNNNRFLSSCSYLEAEIKLSTSGSDLQHHQLKSSRRVSAQDVNTESARSSRRKYSQPALDNREKRYQNPLSEQYSARKGQTPTRKNNYINVKVHLVPQRLESKKNNLLETTLLFATQFIPQKALRKKSLKRKHAFNPQVDSYFSPYVYIRIIDKIKDLSQVQDKSIKVNFEKIYKKLIKTQLMGEFTANFMEAIEKYIREIVERNEMHLNPFDIELQPELKNISRKDEFLQKLISLWQQGETLKIHQLVKYYCIPSQQTSAKILEELINDLVIEIYQKKSCNRSIDYILMNENGQWITHISQIYFSTMFLLIAPQETARKDYLQYHHLIEQHNKSLKMTMRQSIRHSFIDKIVKEKFDENKVNYHDDPHSFAATRKEAVQQAATMIQSKSKMRLQARKQKQEMQMNLQKFLQQKPPTSRNDNLFTNYVLRKRKQRKQYCQILERLRVILDPNHVYEIKSNLHDSTEEQFRKLRLFNDKYDITYNYNKDNSNKIILINMIENCSIFNKKTTEQLEKLLNMLESIYGKGMDNINQIFYWQFQEIYETAHGVANQDVIMKFVLNYLAFDEFGQLDKQDFFQIMDICLSQTGRAQRIIKLIIWNYFQKTGLIQNNVLRKQNLEIWYEPIKIVYMLLLSIIFGYEYASVQEMIHDLLKYDYQ